MHMAACRNNAEAIRILAKAGADINKKTKHGTTPIISAAKQGAIDAIIALIDLGADLSVKNEKGAVDILKDNYNKSYLRVMQYISRRNTLALEDSHFKSCSVVDFDI